MDKSERKRKEKEIHELVNKIDDAIPGDATHDMVLHALCILIVSQCAYLRKSGFDIKTFLETVSKRIACAISVAETFE